jgi:hypothetical protein
VKRLYRAAVAATAGAHFAYLIYLPSGGFLALRWPRTLLLHVPTVLWGVAVVGLRFPCPLTSLERWARARAQLEPLAAGGFIDHYADGVLYPPNRTGAAQSVAFLAAALSWAVLADRHFRRRVGRTTKA